MSEVTRSLVKEGLLNKSNLGDILTLAAENEHFTAVELRDRRDLPVGAIFLKAHQVVHVEPAVPDARTAFRALMQSNNLLTYRIYRLAERKSYARVDSLGRLLVESAGNASDSATRPAVELPRRPAMTMQGLDPRAEPDAAAEAETAPEPAPRKQVTQEFAGTPTVTDDAGMTQGLPTPTDTTQRTTLTGDPSEQSARASTARYDQPEAGPSKTIPSLREHRPASSPSIAALPDTVAETPAPTDPAPPKTEDRKKAMPRTSSGHLITICSPKGGVGKTTVSLNLAVAMARQHRTVILADVDPNGDIASALDAHERIERGLYDVLAGDATIDDCLRGTALPNLRVLPARGKQTSIASLDPEVAAARLPAMLGRLARPGTIILLDCPAGMFGISRAAMRCATHAVGVLQAESIASRSFDMLLKTQVADPDSPELIGVIVNMFTAQSQPAFSAFQKVAQQDGYRTFDTPVPRSEVFSRAAALGQPTAGAVGAIFASLAEEIIARLGISRPQAITTEPFLT